MIDFLLIYQSLPLLLWGLVKTITIATLSCCIGISLGLALGIIQSSRNLLYYPTFAYITIIRGTPMLLQIFAAYHILLELGFGVSAFWVATGAIGLNSGAYMSQIIRASILSVSAGQKEAAQVLGFTPFQTMAYIILPQALRVALPSLGNEFITLVKDSSLASTIGIAELFKQGQAIMSRTYDAFSIFAAVGCLYLLVTSLLSVFFFILEKRLDYHAQNR